MIIRVGLLLAMVVAYISVETLAFRSNQTVNNMVQVKMRILHRIRGLRHLFVGVSRGDLGRGIILRGRCDREPAGQRADHYQNQ